MAGSKHISVDTKTSKVTDPILNLIDVLLTLGGFTIDSSGGVKTINLGAVSGVKIGTTGDKIGFLGATPVVQPTGNALSALALLGLVASPSLTIADITALQAALDLKAGLVSPALSGTPTAPTAANVTSNTQLATTQFVHALLTDLVNASPAALDTLKELADAIGDDPNFATTVATLIATKLAKSANLSDLTDAAAARVNLALGNVNNTSDANKPVSTAQAAADAVISGALATHAALTNNPHGVTAAQVGLATAALTNVANSFSALQTFNAIAASSVIASQLANPAAPTVTPIGSDEGATWSYKIVAKLSDGTPSAAGPAGTTTHGDQTLDATNKNSLAWTAVPGAASYDVYRTAVGVSPVTTGKIANVLTNAHIDTGAAGDGSTAPATNSTGRITAHDFTGDAGPLSLTPVGTGAIARTLAARLNETVNVKDFGALGDGVTNDTANIDKAIAVANAGNLTLVFPPGIYLITAGGLTNDIKCSVYGPQAILQAVNYTAGIGALVTINYNDGENNSRRTFEIRDLAGAGSQIAGSGVGAGLYIRNSSSGRFIIGNVRFFNQGIFLDASAGIDQRQIGVNDFYVAAIVYNKYGIVLNSGSTGNNQSESNRFFINYFALNSTAAILISNGAYSNPPDENVFDIVALEINIANAHGIVTESSAERNTFTVHGILGGASGTGKTIVADGTDNVFNIIRPDWSLITSTGNNIWHTDAFAKDGSGRSRINGIAPPTTGHWRIGDMVWNNAGNAPDGWRCSVAGTPGTWEVIGSILAPTDSTNLPVYAANENRARTRYSQVTNFPGAGNFNRVFDIVASGDAGAGAWIRLLVAPPNTAPVSCLWLSPNGGLVLSATPPTVDPGYGHLVVAAIDQDPVTPVTVFSNGWGNFGGSQEPTGYYKGRDGRIYLVGGLAGGTTTRSTTMWTLPVGYRPGFAKVVAVASFNGTTDIVGIVEIGTDGAVKFNAGSNVFISLSGISFRP